jgi:hypothetical protein
MKRFTDPIRGCIEHHLWMPALTTALTLPDICSWLENPAAKSVGERYKGWAKRWFEAKYSRYTVNIHKYDTPEALIAAKPEVFAFLSAADLYALRCAISHNGSEEISQQKAKDLLDRFAFTIPVKGSYTHMNMANTTLQLQIDIFCEDLCESVEEWDELMSTNLEVQERKSQLVTFRNPSLGASW